MQGSPANEESMLRILRLTLAFAALTTLTRTAAQPFEDWERCANRGVSADERISGCGALIQLGKQTQSNLAKAFNNRGLAYQAKGDNEQAIVDFTEAIRLEPKFAHAFYNRSTVYQAEDDFDRAIAGYTEAIQLDSNYVRALNNRGLAYQAKGDNDRAIVDYSEAIRIDPKFVHAYRNRGTAYRAKGDIGRAIADFDKADELSADRTR
jgi:tetratricopeptide (TPR) repeat protein